MPKSRQVMRSCEAYIIFFRHISQNNFLFALVHILKNRLDLSFDIDVVLCSVSVIPLQHRSCSVCMSFVRLGHHNG